MKSKLSVTGEPVECKITYMMRTGEKIKSTRLAKKISQEQLAKFIKVSRTAIIDWEKNKHLPKGTHLLKCAEFLGVSPHWLANEKNNYEDMPGYIKTKQIPLISWECLLQKGKDFLCNLNKEDLEMIIVPLNVGEKTFAVKVVSDSMTSPNTMTSFLPHEIIVIDPDKSYKHGSFVVARTEIECHFRQYFIDGGIAYLKPLNPQYPLLKADEYEIIGTCCYKLAEIE